MRRSAWMIDRLSAQVQAQKLMDEHEYQKARDLLLELIDALERAGVPAGHPRWLLSIAYDNLGDLPQALIQVEKAIEVDPGAVPFHRSFDIIIDHIRDALADESRDAGDPIALELHELLVRSGEAVPASHLGLARHLVAAGQAKEALRLLDALVTLDPLYHEAWKLLAVAARAAGLQEKAERAELEAAATADQGPGSAADRTKTGATRS